MADADYSLVACLLLCVLLCLFAEPFRSLLDTQQHSALQKECAKASHSALRTLVPQLIPREST